MMIRKYRRLRAIQTKSCMICSSQYTSIRRDSLYCSNSCAVTAYNQRLESKNPEKFREKLKQNANRRKERRIASKVLELKKQEDLRVLEEKRRIEALRQQKEQEEMIQRKKYEYETLKRERELRLRTSEAYEKWRENYIQSTVEILAKYEERYLEQKTLFDEYVMNTCRRDQNGKLIVPLQPYDGYAGAYTRKKNEFNAWVKRAELDTDYNEAKKFHTEYFKQAGQEEYLSTKYETYIKISLGKIPQV